MPNSDRLITLIQELGDRTPRHVGGVGGSYIDEGEWAAKHIASEYGMEALELLSQRARLCLMLPHDNLAVIQQIGFQSPDLAARWKQGAIYHVRLALEGIDCNAKSFSDMLSSDNPDDRADAAAALGIMRASDCVPDLIPLLDDANELVRKVALTALKEITGKSFLFGSDKSAKWSKWWSKKN